MKIFVSYAREELEVKFVSRLECRLEKVSMHTWRDVKEIVAGEDWVDKIDIAIKNSSALLLIMSNSGFVSEYVNYEWAFALGAGVPVLPLLVEANVCIHPRLQNIQHIDFTKDESQSFIQLKNRLLQLTNPDIVRVEKLKKKLNAVDSKGASSVIRELLSIPNNLGYEVINKHVDTVVDNIHATRSIKIINKCTKKLRMLHFSGAPGIRDKLLVLLKEYASNEEVERVLNEAYQFIEKHS